MARTKAAFTGDTRLSDHFGMSMIEPAFPRGTVNATLRSPGQDSRRRRPLPADVMACHASVMARRQQFATREVLHCLEGGMRWISPGLPVRVSGHASIPPAHTRLGAAPFSALRYQCVAQR